MCKMLGLLTDFHGVDINRVLGSPDLDVHISRSCFRCIDSKDSALADLCLPHSLTSYYYCSSIGFRSGREKLL